MSGKSETHSKDTTTAAHPESHGCCGGASAAEPATKASKPTDPAAVGRANPSAAEEKGCCCGGGSKTSKHLADPKR
jgi:hypothetical protein